MSGGPVLVDARGLLCPWPVLRLSRAARQLTGGEGEIRLLADDPSAGREIAELCRERGWALSRDPGDEAAFEVGIR